MKVIKLKLTNVKGATRELRLSGRDLFTGPNGAGKSTNLEGFLVGMLGYVPGRGKQLADVYRLASGEEMTVGLETDSDFKCSRTIREKCRKSRATGEKNYSLTMEMEVFPPRGEKGDNDKQERITKELGDTSVLLDLGALFALSDAERRKFIFSLTDPAQFGWDRDKFIAAITGQDLRFAAQAKELATIWDPGASVQENVARALEWVKSELSARRAELKKSQAAKEQLLAQKRELGSDPGSAAELAAELEAARADLAKLTGDLAAAQEKVRSARNLRVRIENYQTKLQAPEPRTHAPEVIEKLRNELVLATAEVAGMNSQRESLEADEHGLQAEVDACYGPSREADAKVASLRALINKVEASKGVCPLMGAQCQADLAKFTAEARGELLAAEQQASDCYARGKGFSDRLATTRDSIRKFTKSVEARSASVAASQRTLDAMIKGNELAQKDLEARNNLRSEIEKAQAELTALQVVDVGPLEAAKLGMAGRVADLERELNKRQAIANLLSSFDRANLEAEELAQTVDILDDLARFVGPTGLQGTILRDTIAPLITKVNELLGQTGRGYNLRTVMQGRNGQEILDFAWERGGQSISYDSLSGGEKVVFGAALGCSLVLTKNPPCKALVIEASECDAGNMRALMEAIGQFGASLDNVLIATHVEPPAVEGWTIHRLTPGEPVRTPEPAVSARVTF
ncbi:MAG: AAA family ATPase [Armatimonadia bacterium]